MAALVIIIFIGFIGGMAFMVYRTMNKLKEADSGIAVDSKNIETSQDFIPFADIKNDVIDLGEFKYRTIIECSSTNYNLKTGEERNTIEMAFKKFLNTLQHPISIFVQTKELNFNQVLETLEGDVNETVKNYPLLANYANQYYLEIANLKYTIQNTKQKKKFIIVPFEDAAVMTELKPEEKYEYSVKELRTRTDMIIGNLASVGIKGRMLKTNEIVELFYSVYHRDDDTIGEFIENGEYFTDVVTDGEQNKQEDPLDKTILILHTAENAFKINIPKEGIPYKAEELFESILGNIRDMKQGLMDIKSGGGLDTLMTDEEFVEAGLKDGSTIVFDHSNDDIDDDDYE